MKDNFFNLLFFSLIFVMLFLGDGPPSYVNMAGAGMIIVLRLVARSYLKTSTPVPKHITLAWAAFLSYLVINSIFSIDIGYSIRSITRFFMAYLIFELFYTRAGKDIRMFSYGLIIFTVMATGVSLLFYIVPSVKHLIPSMNLFWSSAGHNHITDLWLLALPQILLLAHLRTRNSLSVLVVVFIIFVISKARAASVLAVGVVSVFAVSTRGRKIFDRWHYVVLLLLCTIVLFWSLIIPEVPWIKSSGIAAITAQKTSLVSDRRFEYWNQALRAIDKKPLFGYGAGTFHLLSHRFQSKPSNSTWFAHNYLLEITAENGIIGLGLFIWVLLVTYVSTAWKLFRTKSVVLEKKTLLISPAILLLYGQIDFSLSYLVVWFLFWAAIGIATHNEA